KAAPITALADLASEAPATPDGAGDANSTGAEPPTKPDEPGASVPPQGAANTDAAPAPANANTIGPGTGNGGESTALAGFAGKVLAFAYGIVGQLALLVTFLVLALVEVRRFARKLEECFPPRFGPAARDAMAEIADTLQRYMLLRTAVSAA